MKNGAFQAAALRTQASVGTAFGASNMETAKKSYLTMSSQHYGLKVGSPSPRI